MTDADTWRKGRGVGGHGVGEAGGPRGEGREEAGGMGLMVWTDVVICACAQERETGRITVQVSEGGEGRWGRGVVRHAGRSVGIRGDCQ